MTSFRWCGHEFVTKPACVVTRSDSRPPLRWAVALVDATGFSASTTFVLALPAGHRVLAYSVVAVDEHGMSRRQLTVNRPN